MPLTGRKTGRDIRGLYGIVDNTFVPDIQHVELAGKMLIGGCSVLQLRMKGLGSGLWDKKVFDVAKEIMDLKKRYDFTFIINDYVDVAAELGSDGVHVGAEDMPIAKIRKRTGSRPLVGYSSHSIEEATAAEAHGADYVALGAIYKTPLKGPDHPVQGVQKLKELVKKVHIPVVAIGGINRTNIDEVLSSGVAAVAMIRGLVQAKDVAGEARWFVEKFKS